MVEKSKYCSDVMKKHFNKKLVMTKKDNQDFKNSARCSICDNDCVYGNVKVRDNCHENVHIEVEISRLSKIKIFLSYFTT